MRWYLLIVFVLGILSVWAQEAARPHDLSKAKHNGALLQRRRKRSLGREFGPMKNRPADAIKNGREAAIRTPKRMGHNGEHPVEAQKRRTTKELYQADRPTGFMSKKGQST